MNVVLFGATGMVGQGVLRECLLDPGVRSVLSVVRRPSGRAHPKLREVVHENFLDFSSIEAELSGKDTCFFCLGVSSLGLTEEAYRRVTYEITVAATTTLAKVSPNMTFVFVSGAGSDSTERGPRIWARVKGMAENAVLRAPFRASYVFRPGYIQPLHGVTSRTNWYRVFYAITRPVMPLLVRLMPKYATTTEQIGRAMLGVAKHGAPQRILDSAAINAVQ
jgi:uncharacterized protein YbjT (DUF2867 family)